VLGPADLTELPDGSYHLVSRVPQTLQLYITTSGISPSRHA
jgi:hypothetical protein